MTWDLVNVRVVPGFLPAGLKLRIKSPQPRCRVGLVSVMLCRFIRESADSDAGSCHGVPDRSATYEQTASKHGGGVVPSSLTERDRGESDLAGERVAASQQGQGRIPVDAMPMKSIVASMT